MSVPDPIRPINFDRASLANVYICPDFQTPWVPEFSIRARYVIDHPPKLRHALAHLRFMT